MKKTTLLIKTFFTITLLLAMVSYAKAQHCEGCTVNINGPEYITVGDTVTFTVTPSMPWFPYSVEWDDLGFLYGMADIIDQGKNGNGDEYITLYFHGSGNTWFTYKGRYGGVEDFDELYLYISN